MYVAFMGTKAMRDIISDVNYVQTALWPGLLEHSSVRPFKLLAVAQFK